MTSQRVQELEQLLATIRESTSVLLDIEMWERWGSQHLADEEKARYAADATAAHAARTQAKRDLEELVTRTRAEAPDEIAAWADAHDRFLEAYLGDCKRQGKDDTGVFVAEDGCICLMKRVQRRHQDDAWGVLLETPAAAREAARWA